MDLLQKIVDHLNEEPTQLEAVESEKVIELNLEGTDIVPKGYVYVCGACGKTSKSRYGFDAEGKNVADPDWDESCIQNAILCYEVE